MLLNGKKKKKNETAGGEGVGLCRPKFSKGSLNDVSEISQKQMEKLISLSQKIESYHFN